MKKFKTEDCKHIVALSAVFIADHIIFVINTLI